MKQHTILIPLEQPTEGKVGDLWVTYDEDEFLSITWGNGPMRPGEMRTNLTKLLKIVSPDLMDEIMRAIEADKENRKTDKYHNDEGK